MALSRFFHIALWISPASFGKEGALPSGLFGNVGAVDR
jgi:hypothetical protein